MKNKSGTWWITIGAILQVISIVIIEIHFILWDRTIGQFQVVGRR